MTIYARAAVEHAELMERVGLARAAIDDVYRQITVVGEIGAPSVSFAACANARTCATRAADALAAVAVFVEAMGE